MTVYLCYKSIKRLLYISFLITFLGSVHAQVLINELCASNRSVITDSNGETPDWIELYNPNDFAVSLNDFFISDDPLLLNKFRLTSTVIDANAFLIIYASDRNEITNEIHTNFKLSSEGESLYLSNFQGDIIDSIVFPSSRVDFSYGRSSDGGEDWLIFDNPTPQNSNESGISFVNMIAPSMSHESGFYRTEIDVAISSNPNNNIARYTTDGTRVSDDSPIFEGLTIRETTNLRIAFFDENNAKGNENNIIYFYENFHQLPVAHISADDPKLFDEEFGMFSRGPDADEDWPFFNSNFWKDIEVPISFTYFENNELQVEYQLGMKIHGGKASRTNPMQSLRLIADEDYGDEEMNYAFFPESANTRFRRLVLRNASGDYNFTHFRDGYLARYFAKEELNLDLIQFRPTVVYINGVYYGLLHLREKIDELYVEENYGYFPHEIDLLEKDTQIVVGDFDSFDEHVDFLYTNDLSSDEVFETVRNNFDLEEMSDYFVVQSVVNNTDWPRNNIKYWKPKEEGKWRYFLFDMDVAMGRHGWTVASENYLGEWVDTLSNATFYNIMRKFWENETYKNEFVTRYCDLLNSTFKVENWLDETVETKETLEPEIRRHFEKWSNGGFDWWQETGIPRLYEFVEQREDYAREFLRERFEYSDAEQINLNVNPPAAGFFDVNTIEVNNLPWDGFYFDEIESNITAYANPGFTFSHWEINGNVSSTIDLNNLKIKDFEDLDITAHFEGEFTGPNSNIYPNPSDGQFILEFLNNANDSVTLTLYDNLGRVAYNLETEILSAGENTLEIDLGSLHNGLYLLNVNLGEHQETKKILIQNEN